MLKVGKWKFQVPAIKSPTIIASEREKEFVFSHLKGKPFQLTHVKTFYAFVFYLWSDDLRTSCVIHLKTKLHQRFKPEELNVCLALHGPTLYQNLLVRTLVCIGFPLQCLNPQKAFRAPQNYLMSYLKLGSQKRRQSVATTRGTGPSYPLGITLFWLLMQSLSLHFNFAFYLEERRS